VTGRRQRRSKQLWP